MDEQQLAYWLHGSDEFLVTTPTKEQWTAIREGIGWGFKKEWSGFVLHLALPTP